MKKDQTTVIESELYRDAIEGLSKKPKQLPSKYFYDKRGSDLFEQITELDEYYPTDCEMEIMRRYIIEITSFLGPKIQLVELGSGSSMKTRLLLEHCKDVMMYVPVDISGSYIEEVADQLREEFPGIDIHPVAADYTSPFIIAEIKDANKRVIYFPGSTIGNFNIDKAKTFLNTIADNLTSGDGLLIGVDLKKDVSVLEAAYNDSKGVTAAFNKNILTRLNRELNTDFDLNQFRHRAFYNYKKGRIEMHLESLRNQKVQINGQQALFKKGETIHTENSHKYTIQEFEKLTDESFSRIMTWTDSRDYFSVHYFEKI
ncbi:L-histidine N(alpha)-methyltransferase [soil metagenome]